IEEGYGLKLADLRPGTQEFERMAKMHAHAWYFAASKQERYIEDIQNALVGLDPEEFKLFKENYHYVQNRLWLEAERDMILANAQMAERWHYMQDVDLPNLKYVTAGDDRVRLEHQALDGINLPMDSPFWLKNYPPNGYRCRCDVEQNDDPVTSAAAVKEKMSAFAPETAFDINSGITGQ